MSTTPAETRIALLISAAQADPHVSAAVRLLAVYKHGRFTAEPDWVDAFVHVSKSGHASVDWKALGAALDGADHLDRAVREAVLPFSTTELGVMRFACDLGSGRWGTAGWDAGAAGMVVGALEEATVPRSRGGGVVNSIGGPIDSGSLIVQTGDFRGDLVL